MAFGAFLAGMMLGETEFRHQIESAIRPFRDMLLGDGWMPPARDLEKLAVDLAYITALFGIFGAGAFLGWMLA